MEDVPNAHIFSNYRHASLILGTSLKIENSKIKLLRISRQQTMNLVWWLPADCEQEPTRWQGPMKLSLLTVEIFFCMWRAVLCPGDVHQHPWPLATSSNLPFPVMTIKNVSRHCKYRWEAMPLPTIENCCSWPSTPPPPIASVWPTPWLPNHPPWLPWCSSHISSTACQRHV